MRLSDLFIWQDYVDLVFLLVFKYEDNVGALNEI